MAKVGFILPKPDKIKNKYIWHPVARMGRMVPWGYEIDPNDNKVLRPIPDQLELLEEAKQLKKKNRHSYRELAAWLTMMTGRPISHVGLMQRFQNEHRRKTKAEIQRSLAKKYKEALEKAEELEKTVGGEATREPNPDFDEGSGDT